MEAKRITLIDDDVSIHDRVSRLFHRPWFDLQSITLSIGATARALRHRPDVVILDLDLGGMSGESLIAILRARLDTRIVLFSSHDESTIALRCHRSGADAWCPKSNLLTLDRMVREQLDRVSLRRIRVPA